MLGSRASTVFTLVDVLVCPTNLAPKWLRPIPTVQTSRTEPTPAPTTLHHLHVVALTRRAGVWPTFIGTPTDLGRRLTRTSG